MPARVRMTEKQYAEWEHGRSGAKPPDLAAEIARVKRVILVPREETPQVRSWVILLPLAGLVGFILGLLVK